MAHALLGASSSHRWLHCTPSARLEEHVPNVSSEYANEGTLAHAFGARWLKSRLNLDTSAEMKEIQEYLSYLTDEMPGFVDQYASRVWNCYLTEREAAEDNPGSPEPELHVEQHLDYGPWVPEGFGTGDAVIVGKGQLWVLDLKYGKGVKVMAQDNPQLKLYALAALDIYDYAYDIQKVTVGIFQPRLNHYDFWTITAKALREWAENELKPKALLAWEGRGERVAGSWCKFCRIKNSCPEQATNLFEGLEW